MAIASLTVAQSCIFEDREHCPVYLTLDFSGVPEEVGNVLLFLEHEDGYLYRDTVYSRDFRSTYEIPVQKGRYHVAAFGNISEMVFDGGYCVTPGRQADSLYTCFHTASYTGDLAADTINMAKDHIGLHIRVLGRAEDPDSIFVRIESSSVGYSLYGDIIGGTYIHVPEAAHIAEDDAGYYEFSSRILRQKEEDLTLEICAVDNGADTTLTAIPLAARLQEAGIAMDSVNLEDVYLTIDYAHYSMTVSPVDWYDNGQVEIEF